MSEEQEETGHSPGTRKEAVYDFVVQFIKQHQKPPTLREVCGAGVGQGTNNGVITAPSIVRLKLKRLEEEGRIKLEPGVSRGIRVPRLHVVHLTEEQEGVLHHLLLDGLDTWPGQRERIERILGEFGWGE